MITNGLISLDRMVQAVALVRQRLERGAEALERAEIAFAVIGGNAVFLWMTQHGEGGERFTPNVDFLIRRDDLDRAAAALEMTGFVSDPDRPALFRDGENGSPRTRLRLLFADEKVRAADLLPNPSAACLTQIGGFSVLSLHALVQTKLTANRLIDRVHLRDLLDVGLIDASWKARYPPHLAERLHLLIDTPDG